MKTLFKLAIVVLVFVVNLAIAHPSLADRPKVSKNSDYVQVTKALDGLLALKETQDTTPELQQQIDELTLQKATIESGVNWGQCSNATGRTIGIFGSALGESKTSNDPLYFLADGETTPEEWDCQGVYLPSGTNVAGINSTPAVFKILDGTRLVARINPDTSAIEFNVPAVKSGAGNEKIANVSQAFIDSRIPSTLTAGEIDD
ncbi:hypothetical protein H6F43_02800 [Leptolyngbya sp. FACHB-36]|uniref:hypothetical protein n=1 Tax=Leptolyngbya sp. FACHB-36 TaxID=2692808 RepID=UPI0016818B26|nr:hypothetical protein [Leptolyngbya sp. FACHB-36]MBD2019113.1 hypothetical protein [Leptolyngbya sp. FACHB-36]